MVKFGVIGRNFVVDWMMECAQQVPEAQFTAIYSRKMETGLEFAEKYGVSRSRKAGYIL